MPGIRTVRVHDLHDDDAGARYLVDRLWPRGVAKASLRLTGWARDAAPSDELRRWFGHDPERFGEFRSRYLKELKSQRDRIAELRRRAKEGPLTILYGARDREHNDAVVLADLLRGR